MQPAPQSTPPRSRLSVDAQLILATVVALLVGIWLTNISAKPTDPGSDLSTTDKPDCVVVVDVDDPDKPVAPPAAAGPSEPVTPGPPSAQSSAEAPSQPTVSLLRDQLVGRWQLNESIFRDIEVRDDGTATMQVKLDFVSSLMYGSAMTLQLAWKLDQDVLTHTITSGEPKANVDKLIKDFGNSKSYRIMKVEPRLMVLESIDSEKSTQRWQRY
ncbi:hypothetical protein [Planctomicrobium sp. SH664]|uniref:hypothetical protein n=1 Tax=Planctomicrobium sp. SH664 TaxID=3448125 RepID=UPI003F5B89C5